MDLNTLDNKKFFNIVLLLVVVLSVTITVTTTYGVNTIGKEPFSVTILADASRGPAPFNVSFSALVTNYRGDLNYEWDFGNNESSEKKQPFAIFDEGEYICRLTVTDRRGNVDHDTLRIVATQNQPPSVILSINQYAVERKLTWLSMRPRYAYAGDQQLRLYEIENQQGVDAWGTGRVTVTAQINDPENDDIVSYNWTIRPVEKLVCRDGTELHPVNTIEGEQRITIPELYTWMALEHIITLTVTDSAGNTGSDSIRLLVSKNRHEGTIRALFTLLTQ